MNDMYYFYSVPLENYFCDGFTFHNQESKITLLKMLTNYYY